jgi:hypothetical protein
VLSNRVQILGFNFISYRPFLHTECRSTYFYTEIKIVYIFYNIILKRKIFYPWTRYLQMFRNPANVEHEMFCDTSSRLSHMNRNQRTEKIPGKKHQASIP